MDIKIDNFIWNFASYGHIDHPIHEVETEKHDGENNPTVFVNVTGSNAEYLGGRLGLNLPWKERSDGLSRQGVGSSPTAGVELHSSFLNNIEQINNNAGWFVTVKCRELKIDTVLRIFRK